MYLKSISCFPEVQYNINKTDWFAELPNGSEIWFGGLDDKDRTEKILGQEYATIFLNECSQISYGARNIALTRLAQSCTYKRDGKDQRLRLKMLYDCNPPSQAHWTYKLFKKGIDPESKKLVNKKDYNSLTINPLHNKENLPEEYITTLESLPARARLRFLEGVFGDITEGALWSLEGIETYRQINNLPDMQRIVIAVDPSGAGDADNAHNDAIGIVVCGLGIDGNGYLLEDITVKAGPATWGKVATTAYDRHSADLVVGEANFGGAMVEHVIQTARRNTPYKSVTASRGKVVRAEPISALAETGKIRHAGNFPELEDELKLTPYKDILTMGKNAVKKTLAPARTFKAKKKAELEMAIISETIATVEADIEEACGKQDIDFKYIISKMDQHALSERKLKQFKKIIAEMFPEK